LQFVATNHTFLDRSLDFVRFIGNNILLRYSKK